MDKENSLSDVDNLIEASRRLYNIVSGENLTNEEMNEKFSEFKLDKPLYRKNRDLNRDVDLVSPFSDFDFEEKLI